MKLYHISDQSYNFYRAQWFFFYAVLILFLADCHVVSAQVASAVPHSSSGNLVIPGDGHPLGGLVLGRDGNLYGTTADGGTKGKGTIFKVTSAGSYTILHSFQDGSVVNDGAEPLAGLVLGRDNNLYGTTYAGGAKDDGKVSPSSFGNTRGSGTVFKVTSTGAVTILHSFQDGSVANDGKNPGDKLVLGGDGNFYGTTFVGGLAGTGTVFKITPSGRVTILHSFRDGSVANDGRTPNAALIQGRDGNLYGTTAYGGLKGYNNTGTVFRITLGGTLTILHSFSDVATDPVWGAVPESALIQGSDNNFFGTTVRGGSKDSGTVFKMLPSGDVIVLHSFQDGSVKNDGIAPKSTLVQGQDGSFYGMTQDGGSAGGGTVFRITADGAMTILHSFRDGSVINDGSFPRAALVLGIDGNFYGVTPFPGSVFRMTPGGKISLLYHSNGNAF